MLHLSEYEKSGRTELPISKPAILELLGRHVYEYVCFLMDPPSLTNLANFDIFIPNLNQMFGIMNQSTVT